AASGFRGCGAGPPPGEEALVPPIPLRPPDGTLDLEALIRLDRLSAAYPRAPLRIGLSAVIEADHGALSYWALRHIDGKPDFHDAEAFALSLEPPGQEC